MGRCPKDGPALCARFSCVAEMNAVAPIADKLDPSIGRLSADKDGEVIAGPRFEYMVEHLHRLGTRPLAELLIEIAHGTGQSSLIADRLQEYSRLDPAVVRALGADSFAPSVLCAVRQNDEAAE